MEYLTLTSAYFAVGGTLAMAAGITYVVTEARDRIKSTPAETRAHPCRGAFKAAVDAMPFMAATLYVWPAVLALMAVAVMANNRVAEDGTDKKEQ